MEELNLEINDKSYTTFQEVQVKVAKEDKTNEIICADMKIGDDIRKKSVLKSKFYVWSSTGNTTFWKAVTVPDEYIKWKINNTENKNIIEGNDIDNNGQITITAECLGLEITKTVDIIPDSINIYTPDKRKYQTGEELDLEGMEVIATYKDGTERLINLSDVTITGYNKNEEGKQTITVEYKGVTATFKIKVQAPELGEPKESIWEKIKFNSIAYSEISNGPPINTAEHFEFCGAKDSFTSLKGDVRPTKDGEIIMCHDAGFTLDQDGKITTYSSAKRKLIKDMTKAECLALEHETQYNGKYCSVIDFETYIKICKKYNKIPYITVRDELIEEIVVPRIMEILEKYDMVDECIINSFTYETLQAFRAEDGEIKLSWVISCNTDVFTLEDIDKAKKLKKCLITMYEYHATDSSWDSLKKYSSEYTKHEAFETSINYAKENEVELYDCTYGKNNTTTIMRTLWLKGITGTQFSFSPVKGIEKIEIKNNPKKMQYIKDTEELNLTGGKITAYYLTGTQGTISLTDSNIKIEGFDNSKIGKNTLKITYRGASTNLDVDIIDKPKYTATFILNNGEANITKTQEWGTELIAPSNPSKEGYTFDGWSEEVPSVMPKEDKTYTAKWKVKEYTINYNLNGGTNSKNNPNKYTIENTINLENASKAGHTFEGWYDNAKFTGNKVTKIEKRTGEITLYAKFTANDGTCIVEYYKEKLDGTYEKDDNATETIKSKVEKPIEATAKKFSGYTYDATNRNNITNGTIPTEGTLTLKLYYARNNSTATFVLNNGAANIEKTQKWGTALTAPREIEKEGYEFEGWTPTVPSTMPIESTTYTAKWRVKEYTINYNLNGGTNSKNNPAKYTIEDKITLENATKAGHTFEGWYENGEFTGNKIAKIENRTGEITLYAKFTKQTYTVTFILDNGEENIVKTQEWGTELIAPSNPSKEGYTFDGWSEEVPSVMPKENKTYIAKWKENLKVEEQYEIKKEGGITYLTNIKPDTTVAKFVEKISTNASKIEIIDNKAIKVGEYIKQQNGTYKWTGINGVKEGEKKIGTGYEIKVSLNEETASYTLVVTGDLNGDGEMSDGDLMRLARYIAKLDTSLKGVYLEAADIHRDGSKAQDSDLMKMARVLVELDSL